MTTVEGAISAVEAGQAVLRSSLKKKVSDNSNYSSIMKESAYKRLSMLMVQPIVNNLTRLVTLLEEQWFNGELPVDDF